MGAGCGRRAVLVYSNSREYFKQRLWIAAAVTGYEAGELHIDPERRLWATRLNFSTAKPRPFL